MTRDPHDTSSAAPVDRIDVFVDDATEPLLSTTPPLNFELDTSLLEDGPHLLRIEAYDSQGVKGVRTIDFSVRNGPGIAVSGIRQNDVLDGTIPVIVNAYGGTSAVHWEPSQAETPAPPPTWAWVLLILVSAFGLFYGIEQWSPSPDFARTPTYGTFAGTTSPVDAAAAAAVPAVAPADPIGVPTLPAAAPSVPVTTAPPSVETEAAAAASPVTDVAPPVAPGRATTMSAAEAARGSALYSANCAACHQVTGQGLPNVFPPLAGDPLVTAADPSEHIAAVLNGKQGSTINGVSYMSPMPAFRGLLNDADIAAVINHERTSWGNGAPLVTAAEIAALR